MANKPRFGSNSSAAWYATMRAIFPTSMRRQFRTAKKHYTIPRYKNAYGTGMAVPVKKARKATIQRPSNPMVSWPDDNPQLAKEAVYFVTCFLNGHITSKTLITVLKDLLS